ncbi:MAG: hypothetical protein GJ676_04615 [Rhodobacteraceae bacterium]|nr:hypothetical protein [Paracoccaceae bacterium]
MADTSSTTKINGVTTTASPVKGTTGDDTVFTTAGSIGGVPDLPKVYGLAGNDEFSGPGLLYGGPGHDLFFGYGVSDPKHASHHYGGIGNDAFIDREGSSVYHGGKGADLFQNYILTEYVNLTGPADTDEVYLGVGRDIATILNSWYSGPDGYFFAPRHLHVDGGPGIDLLNVFHYSYPLNDPLKAHLDFASIAHGNNTITMGGKWKTLTNFEQFVVEYGSPRLEHVTFGKYSDLFYWKGNTKKDQVITTHLGGGDDLLKTAGEATKNIVYGGKGSDLLISTGGNSDTRRDKLIGGADDDLLFVGTNAVQHHLVDLIGGAGADTFVLQRGYSQDIRVIDFDATQDRLVVDALHSMEWPILKGILTERQLIEDRLDIALANPLGGWKQVTEADITRRENDKRIQIVIDHDQNHANGIDFELMYKHSTQVAKVRINQDDPFEVLARFQGTPDLHADDFLFL